MQFLESRADQLMLILNSEWNNRDTLGFLDLERLIRVASVSSEYIHPELCVNEWSSNILIDHGKRKMKSRNGILIQWTKEHVCDSM